MSAASNEIHQDNTKVMTQSDDSVSHGKRRVPRPHLWREAQAAFRKGSQSDCTEV